MSCDGEMNQTLKWAITLPGHSVPLQFGFPEQINELHKHNLYKQDAMLDMDNTIQLLMNSTKGNNGTKIECVDIGSALTSDETTLTVNGEYTLDHIGM